MTARDSSDDAYADDPAMRTPAKFMIVLPLRVSATTCFVLPCRAWPEV